MSNWLILGVTIVMALLALISIFLYKNRPVQMRVALAGLVCSVGLIFLYYRETRQFLSGQGTLDLTALVVMVIPFLFFLAIRGIYKDEHLVKSVNRLR
jgi:lipopolysaccharide export LptBFGC system permease protein LptF